MSSSTAQETATAGSNGGGRRDFFLSHSQDGLRVALELKQEFDPPANVFLDKGGVGGGHLWADALRRELTDSYVFVFLLTRDSGESIYVTAEKDSAVSLYNDDRKGRRVVPVYLNERDPPKTHEAPFPFGSFEGVAVPDASDLREVKRVLVRALAEVNPSMGRKLEMSLDVREGRRRAESGNELLGGLWQTTRPFRPFPEILLLFWLGAGVMLPVCLLSSLFAGVQFFAATVFLIIFLLMPLILLSLIVLALKYGPRST